VRAMIHWKISVLELIKHKRNLPNLMQKLKLNRNLSNQSEVMMSEGIFDSKEEV
jgi:hypothetical protein